MVSSCLSRTQPRLSQSVAVASRHPSPPGARCTTGSPPGGRPRQAVPGASGTESFRSVRRSAFVVTRGRPPTGLVQRPRGDAEPFAERPMVKHSWLPLLVAPVVAASVSPGCGSAARHQSAPQVTPAAQGTQVAAAGAARRRCRLRPTRSSRSSTPPSITSRPGSTNWNWATWARRRSNSTGRSKCCSNRRTGRGRNRASASISIAWSIASARTRLRR